MSDSTSEDAAERLTALEDTNDGFQLAEKDLELRGRANFRPTAERHAGTGNKPPCLTRARWHKRDVKPRGYLKSIPYLQQPQHALLHQQVSVFWENAGDIS